MLTQNTKLCAIHLAKITLFSLLNIDNVEFSIKLIPKVELRKGKEYLQFSQAKLDFTTTRYVVFQIVNRTIHISFNSSLTDCGWISKTFSMVIACWAIQQINFWTKIGWIFWMNWNRFWRRLSVILSTV